MWYGHLGRVNVAKYRTELLQRDTERVHSASYQSGFQMQEVEKAVIEKMLAKNIIKITQTEWASFIIFVPKKGQTFPVCVDYCKLNGVAKLN